ncbi:hypothetical protein ACP70R_010156 [Stipagrostis hirtigluma subsp. patula]
MLRAINALSFSYVSSSKSPAQEHIAISHAIVRFRPLNYT